MADQYTSSQNFGAGKITETPKKIEDKRQLTGNVGPGTDNSDTQSERLQPEDEEVSEDVGM